MICSLLSNNSTSTTLKAALKSKLAISAQLSPSKALARMVCNFDWPLLDSGNKYHFNLACFQFFGPAWTLLKYPEVGNHCHRQQQSKQADIIVVYNVFSIFAKKLLHFYDQQNLLLPTALKFLKTVFLIGQSKTCSCIYPANISPLRTLEIIT